MLQGFLLFTLTTNLEAGPQFADIWFNVDRYLKGETFEWHLKTGQVYGRSKHHFVLTVQIQWGPEYRTFWYSDGRKSAQILNGKTRWLLKLG